MSADQPSYILAVDLGTSGPKAVLVTTDGEPVATEIESTELVLLPGGGAEQRPDDWWRAIVTATRRMLAANPGAAERVVAVSVSAQWSGTVAVDRNGAPLMNAVTWLDSRGAKYVHEVVGGPVKIEGYGVHKLVRWLRRTGGIPAHSGKDPVGHILFIKHAHPDVYAATYKFLEPKDYINLRLTGQFASSIETITLHWITDNRDIEHIEYDEGLLRMLGLRREQFPDLRTATDVLGPLTPEAARELGLGEQVQVVMGLPDVHAATIGSGAVRDFEPHLYIGTSSWLICHVPYKRTSLAHGIASLPSAIPGRYYVANEQETAGACLIYLRDNVLYPDDELRNGAPPDDIWDALNRLAASVPPGSDKVIFTPWLYGERTPVDDHTVRAAFYNQSLSTTRAHLVRAVFEGVAYNTRWLMSAVESFIKQPLSAINFIGGGAHSDLWAQILADVLQRPIRQMEQPQHAGPRGAAFLASVALGHMTFDDVAARVQVHRTYEPNLANRPVYDELYTAFRTIYKQNKGIYARLNATH